MSIGAHDELLMPGGDAGAVRLKAHEVVEGALGEDVKPAADLINGNADFPMERGYFSPVPVRIARRMLNVVADGKHGSLRCEPAVVQLFGGRSGE